ncbi:hypothetical protein HanIR_Chr15g0759541 [Helianthus annuus]|nr:hypothetical protein HanIR_Chr15g0759541 [Helianthus annuus]
MGSVPIPVEDRRRQQTIPPPPVPVFSVKVWTFKTIQSDGPLCLCLNFEIED